MRLRLCRVNLQLDNVAKRHNPLTIIFRNKLNIDKTLQVLVLPFVRN